MMAIIYVTHSRRQTDKQIDLRELEYLNRETIK